MPVRAEQLIRILDPRDNSSKPIVNIPQSLMKVLADNALYTIRVYVLLAGRDLEKRKAIATHIQKDLPHIMWL
jgi:hypothetical protein